MGNTAKKRVLVADDDRSMREVLKFILLEGRFDVVGEAINGEMAVTLAESLKPDIVCLDINMPRVDGIHALEQIKAKLPGTIVIMISSSATPDNVRDAIGMGAAGFIVKPFSAGKVLDALNKCTQPA